jgi:hypothetical protein
VPKPTASNLNFTPGQTVPNLAVVRVGVGGKFSLYNNSGTTHAVADVVGWYSDGTTDLGARYNALVPARILDSRTASSPIAEDETIDVVASGVGGVPATGVSAVVVNLTVTEPTSASYLTAWPSGEPRSTASNLNYVPGQTIPNLAMVKLGSNGKFSLYNHTGSTHVVADVVGWYSDGSTSAGNRYMPLVPARILDTRQANAPIGQSSTITVPAEGTGGVPEGASAVVVNLTATEPTSAGYLTAWPTGSARPTASNLNFVRGQTVPNLAVVRLGPTGKFSLYNLSGSTHVVVDVVGWFTPAPGEQASDYVPNFSVLDAFRAPAFTGPVSPDSRGGNPRPWDEAIETHGAIRGYARTWTATTGPGGYTVYAYAFPDPASAEAASAAAFESFVSDYGAQEFSVHEGVSAAMIAADCARAYWTDGRFLRIVDLSMQSPRDGTPSQATADMQSIVNALWTV